MTVDWFYDRERAYEDRIRPLVDELIDACEDAGIPVFVSCLFKVEETMHDHYATDSYELPGIHVPAFEKCHEAITGEPFLRSTH